MSAYEQLESHFAKLSHLNHLQAIVNWDEAAMMPPGGATARAKALTTLDVMTHELLTQPKIGDLIQRAKSEASSDPWQQANLFWIERQYLQATCLPTALVKKITESSMRCEQAWRTLRADNNWKDFQPLLENVLTLTKESANIRADVFHQSPYDVLIDSFSPGITQATIDPIFNILKSTLPDLIKKITEKQAQKPFIKTEGKFPIDQQKALGLELMQAIGFDFQHGRLDVSHHPFCGGVPEDVRITTRYDENDFISAIMGICHETGHACYEQGLPKDWLTQPVGNALGMAVHESQSLLIEMQTCRSREFMEFMSPLLKHYFNDQAAFSSDNLHKLYTQVKPGFIRVDADEMTYPLHVILRYEIEKELIEGDMTVSDLPDAWDAMMTKYLGLSTKGNDQDGVMQDVHWPAGLFGYFPAYTLGSLIAAQLFATAKKQHPEILTRLKEGDFTPLMSWLRTHIHAQASCIGYDELMKAATGETLTPDYFLQHIADRYTDGD